MFNKHAFLVFFFVFFFFFFSGIFYLLNNGNPVNQDLMTKILDRVYPDDKGVSVSI